jgi:hypothetical protein
MWTHDTACSEWGPEIPFTSTAANPGPAFWAHEDLYAISLYSIIITDTPFFQFRGWTSTPTINDPQAD